MTGSLVTSCTTNAKQNSCLVFSWAISMEMFNSLFGAIRKTYKLTFKHEPTLRFSQCI